MFKFIFAFLTVLFVLPLNGSATEKLTIVSLEKFAPYSFRDGEQDRGIDVEIVIEAAKRAGFEVEFIFAPWKRVLSLVEFGKVDAGTPAFRRPEREAYASFTSVPLHVSRFNVFTDKKTSFKYTSIESLFGLKVAKIRGYSITKPFDEAGKNGKISVKQLDSIESALQMLVRNRVDVFVNNELSTLYRAKILGLGNRIAMNDTPVNAGEGAYLFFSKAKLGARSKDLARNFDLALQSMLDDGSVQAIIDSYVR